MLRIGIQLLVSKREIAQLAKKEKQQPEVPKEETKTSWEQYADKIVKRIKAEANPPPSNTASDIPFEYPLNKDLNAFGKNAYKLCSTAVNNFQGVVENPRENINKFRK